MKNLPYRITVGIISTLLALDAIALPFGIITAVMKLLGLLSWSWLVVAGPLLIVTGIAGLIQLAVGTIALILSLKE